MGRIKFLEDPFTWIGVRTWPWVSYHHVARARGIAVVVSAVAVTIGFIVW